MKSEQTAGNCIYQPLIIIGAPRSGTNMLRDVITKLNGFCTWPCDEINYIWRHGNKSFPTDEFSSNMADQKTKQFIRKQFQWPANKYNCEYVVEKTCANSLRVEFVDEILPEAKYIYIRRNGYDVIPSAMQRWKAELDLKYIFKKARFVPLSDIPYYLFKYLNNRVIKLFSRKGQLKTWGPKFAGMQHIAETKELDEVCAHQWQKCVQRSEEAFVNMDRKRFVVVEYEKFVTNPAEELGRILKDLNLNYRNEDIGDAVNKVSSRSVGKGKSKLSEASIRRIEPIVRSVEENLNEFT